MSDNPDNAPQPPAEPVAVSPGAENPIAENPDAANLNAENPGAANPAATNPAVASGAPVEAPPSPEVLKAAFKAFKKRIKVTQLDSESRIGRGPMSSGLRSTIDAITPPDQYPRAVWEELVKQKKLVARSHGMYGLAPGA